MNEKGPIKWDQFENSFGLHQSDRTWGLIAFGLAKLWWCKTFLLMSSSESVSSFNSEAYKVRRIKWSVCVQSFNLFQGYGKEFKYTFYSQRTDILQSDNLFNLVEGARTVDLMKDNVFWLDINCPSKADLKTLVEVGFQNGKCPLLTLLGFQHSQPNYGRDFILLHFNSWKVRKVWRLHFHDCKNMQQWLVHRITRINCRQQPTTWTSKLRVTNPVHFSFQELHHNVALSTPSIGKANHSQNISETFKDWNEQWLVLVLYPGWNYRPVRDKHQEIGARSRRTGWIYSLFEASWSDWNAAENWKSQKDGDTFDSNSEA